MRDMKILPCVTLLVFLLVGCGPGISDYEERIGSDGLWYSDSNALSRQIDRLDEEGFRRNVVLPTILRYEILDDRVIGLRQVVNHYLCDGQEFRTGVYFVIDTSQRGEFGVSEFASFVEFQDYLASKDVEAEVSSAYRPDVFMDQMLSPRQISKCENAKLLSDSKGWE